VQVSQTLLEDSSLLAFSLIFANILPIFADIFTKFCTHFSSFSTGNFA
jgi:hypothetical protein